MARSGGRFPASRFCGARLDDGHGPQLAALASKRGEAAGGVACPPSITSWEAGTMPAHPLAGDGAAAWSSSPRGERWVALGRSDGRPREQQRPAGRAPRQTWRSRQPGRARHSPPREDPSALLGTERTSPWGRRWHTGRTQCAPTDRASLAKHARGVGRGGWRLPASDRGPVGWGCRRVGRPEDRAPTGGASSGRNGDRERISGRHGNPYPVPVHAVPLHSTRSLARVKVT
jgi:hypothetical protein